MAAGDLVPFHARYFKAPTDDVAGVQYGAIGFGSVVGEQQGEADAAGGPKAVQLQQQRITVRVFGNNPNALRELIGADAANAVFGTAGESGNELETVKNVVFTEFLGELTIRAPDTGGPVPMIGVQGTAQWGEADTLALMWTSGADA